jgi:hypothetical protein
LFSFLFFALLFIISFLSVFSLFTTVFHGVSVLAAPAFASSRPSRTGKQACFCAK